MATKRYGKLGNPAQRSEVRLKAYELSLKGKSNTAIGEELGVSRETVRTLIKEYIDGLTVPMAEQMRKSEDDKLNRREALLWALRDEKYKVVSHGKVVIDTATGEPVKDIDPLLKVDTALGRIAERRASLWGLNMPTKTEHTVTTTSVVEPSILNAMEELAIKDAKRILGTAD
ncbi:helix-turn-helix domain-containing protein [Streptomyces sp. NBC_00414]|uniref:helix-turn-helix domain-containing protein n=1 Tax=Streptomyces sp. NBC_00414 TaxID=2975739 RepID=UPI002E2207C8